MDTVNDVHPEGAGASPKCGNSRFQGTRRTSYLPDFNPYTHADPLEYGLPGPSPEYANKSLKEVYSSSCETHSCRKNTTLMQSLPEGKGVSLPEFDLSLNFVGRLGLRPVLDVVRCSTGVQRLSFADNFLDNSSVIEISNAIDGIQSITALNMACNPISQSGAKTLNSLLRNNANIVDIQLSNTLINPALKASIQQKALANSQLTETERASRLRQQAALRRNYREQQQFRLRNDVNAPKGSSEARLPYDMLLALEESNDPAVSNTNLENLSKMLDLVEPKYAI